MAAAAAAAAAAMASAARCSTHLGTYVKGRVDKAGVSVCPSYAQMIYPDSATAAELSFRVRQFAQAHFQLIAFRRRHASLRATCNSAALNSILHAPLPRPLT